MTKRDGALKMIPNVLTSRRLRYELHCYLIRIAINSLRSQLEPPPKLISIITVSLKRKQFFKEAHPLVIRHEERER